GVLPEFPYKATPQQHSHLYVCRLPNKPLYVLPVRELPVPMILKPNVLNLHISTTSEPNCFEVPKVQYRWQLSKELLLPTLLILYNKPRVQECPELLLFRRYHLNILRP